MEQALARKAAMFWDAPTAQGEGGTRRAEMVGPPTFASVQDAVRWVQNYFYIKSELAFFGQTCKGNLLDKWTEGRIIPRMY